MAKPTNIMRVDQEFTELVKKVVQENGGSATDATRIIARKINRGKVDLSII